MTTPNLKEIKDAIATLKQKRLEIIGLQEKLEELTEEYGDLYEEFLHEPAYEEIVEIASEIALLSDLGGSDDKSIEQFPVDEPLEKADVVENWEAKDVPHVDEPAAIDAGCFSDGVSDKPSYTPTGECENSTVGFPVKSQGTDAGDENNNSDNSTKDSIE